MTRFTIRNSYIYKRTFQTKCYKTSETSLRHSSEYLSSNNVRQKFLDYFINANNHKYVRSSPVMPYCDPTVAFVNAGMNQFKSIFLGQQDAMFKRVVNTQKCVRVGGKHNDLNVVGSDGYHHTFFEMLGNWSFGDYFKKEACEMAWNLLTGPYGLHPSFLYVTYFGGDSKMNLEPDLECKEIWRSIGIADDHIVPFGSGENFWEMGPVGPCGPCTEIHIDHTGQLNNRSHDVNRNLSNLTELWNIVFIQYNRSIDGQIHLLPKFHIDTGMGLERLTAILQGKNSNYDTDLFSDLFHIIRKKCKGLPEYCGTFNPNEVNEIDTAYRILADHSRMITACLSDGMIPEQNQKLRRIIRKVFLISESVFKESGLLNELAKVVAQNLGHVYPEMEKNLNQVQQIIQYEEEVFKLIRSTATKDWSKILEKEPKLKSLNVLEMPGLIAAYNELKSINLNSITSQLAFKLYDTYGLDENTIKSLSAALNLKFKANDLKKELEIAKSKSQGFINYELNKIGETLMKAGVSKTDDRFKYCYSFKNNSYNFEAIDCRILCILKNDNRVVQIEPNTECYLVLNKTNLYSEAGGQSSDKGRIEFSHNKLFEISETQNVHGYILHKGVLKSKQNLDVYEEGKLFINEQNRLKTMLNHTATHLINAALKNSINGVTCQKSTKVTAELLNFDVGVYSNNKLSVNDIKNVENLISRIIKQSVDVQIKEINSQELLNLDNVTLVPGEVYPDVGIRLVEINNEICFSREPCCGTHVLNTSHIKDICVTNLKSLGRSTTSLIAVTGDRAILAHQNGNQILNDINNIQNSLHDLNVVDDIAEIKQRLNSKNEYLLPIYVRTKCVNILSNINKQLRNVERDSLKEFIDLEMKSVLEANCYKSLKNSPYIVHFLGCSSIIDNIPLQRATKICANLPVIVISYSDEIVKARCCVPKSLVNSEFTAELWLKNTIGKVCKSLCSAPRGQDSNFVCNMKAKRINKLNWESILDEAMRTAIDYAKKNL